MQQPQYINTQQIRQDLMGFLEALANGQKFVVLNRSRPVVTLVAESDVTSKEQARQNIQRFLAVAKQARESATSAPDPNANLKDVYYDDMAKKYGIS